MPTFVEFDKLTGKIKRLLSSEERPPDAGPLSYQILPPGMGDVDLSCSIQDVRAAVAEHFGQEPATDAPAGAQETPDSAPDAGSGGQPTQDAPAGPQEAPGASAEAEVGAEAPK